MLTQLKQAIPGADYWPNFVNNLSEQFEARFSMVKVLNNRSILFKDMDGLKMPIVVSHGEGRTNYLNNNDMGILLKNKQISMQYIDSFSKGTEYYPLNPNGSQDGFTAFTSNDGRATIMMPHPERVFKTMQMSWCSEEFKKNVYSPWMKLFTNARNWVE